MWYLRGTFIADPMLRNRRWWVLLVVWGEPQIGILWDGFPNPRHPFIQAFISGSWLWLLPFILAFVIASVFFERLKLSHSNFHNSFQKRIGPKTPNHWLFLFYWKKSWKKHTFALLKSPHTVPCFLIGFCQILDGWASHWAIHLFKCWTSCFTNKTSFLWVLWCFFSRNHDTVAKNWRLMCLWQDGCRILSLHVHVVWTVIIYLRGKLAWFRSNSSLQGVQTCRCLWTNIGHLDKHLVWLEQALTV